MHDWQYICDAYGPLVWRTIYRVLNDYNQSLDCYQDVMLEAFERTQDRHIENWPSLLRWLAVRRAIDHLRQRNRLNRKVVVSSQLSEAVSTNGEPPEAAHFQELLARVCEELTTLPAHQAEAFWLRNIEDESYATIAEHLGVDTIQVGNLLHRARVRLRKLLKNFAPATYRSDENVKTG